MNDLLSHLSRNPGTAHNRPALMVRLVNLGWASEPRPGVIDHPELHEEPPDHFPHFIVKNWQAGARDGMLPDYHNLKQARVEHPTVSVANYWRAYMQSVRQIMRGPDAPDLSYPREELWSNTKASVYIDVLGRLTYHPSNDTGWPLFSEVGEPYRHEFDGFFEQFAVVAGSYASSTWPYLSDVLLCPKCQPEPGPATV